MSTPELPAFSPWRPISEPLLSRIERDMRTEWALRIMADPPADDPNASVFAAWVIDTERVMRALEDAAGVKLP